MQPLQTDNIRLAATLVLLRERNDELQVYMVERPLGAVFPNLHVFPGGKVDLADDAAAFCDAVSVAQAESLLGQVGSQRYWVTAIRECFEECGVLLLSRDGELLGNAEQLELASYRQRLIDGEVALADVCREHGLRIACGELHYFSHWRTPEVAPKRFDTRFFVAELPASQTTVAHHYEVVDDSWITPADALAKAASGEWQLISPTSETLKSLSAHNTVESLVKSIAQRSHLPALTEELRQEGMCEY